MTVEVHVSAISPGGEVIDAGKIQLVSVPNVGDEIFLRAGRFNHLTVTRVVHSAGGDGQNKESPFITIVGQLLNPAD
ncbi:hypothetical protein WG907_05310 [Sphingobium sp. AN558]|uniref:hypothetical protein n=1 Tax=Sphingobium sp. AN558 TaxID=3133442 RepID=UPI0030C0BB3D